MPFKWSPKLRLISEGYTKPVREELSKGTNTLYAEIPDYDTIVFTVVNFSTMAEHRVDVVLSKSRWVMDHLVLKDEYSFFADDGRTWNPETETGKHAASFLSGISEGDITGKAAASVMFDLFIHLEVELADKKNPWLKEYFPKFFNYHADRLEKIKLRKVEGIMKS